MAKDNPANNSASSSAANSSAGSTTLDQLEAAGLRRYTVDALGARIGVAELGEGPLALFVHGFPESWYSWRNQLIPVAEAGWRAVAIDVRGYGRSSTPSDVADYRMVCHVGDNVGVVRALGGDDATAVVIGHDWGAPIAWHSALLRPDIFTALALLSVPYNPRSSLKPSDAFRALGGDEEFYIEYFQEPGRAEAEIEVDLGRWLMGMYYAASGDGVRARRANKDATGGRFTVPSGGQLSHRFIWPEEGTWPAWMTEDDLAFYLSEFERTGITGGLNRYRNVDRDWADTAAYHGAPIRQPSLFVGGEWDGPTMWGAPAIAKFPNTMPGLRGSHILDGAGHWVQQEAAAEVNGHLGEFLGSLR